MQANVPARTIYYQLYGGQDVDHVTTGNIDDDRSFSPVTSSQENSSAIESNSKSIEEANSKSVKDTGSEVKVYDFSKLLEN